MKKIVVALCHFFILTGLLNAQNINHQNMAGPMGLSVNSFNGNLYFQRNDLFINGRKLPIDLTFYYNSNAYNVNLGFGKGWSLTYLMRWAASSNGGILVSRGDGFQIQFDLLPSTSYKAQAGVFDSLVQYQTGKFKLVTKEKTIYFFDNPAHKRLTRIEEVNGNFLNFSYTDTLLTQITDAASRSLQLTYQNGLLKQVVDALDNPVRTIKYSYDASGNLVTLQDPLNNTLQYSYLINGPLNKFIDKNGNAADIMYNAAYQVKELITCTRDIRYSYSKNTGTTIMLEQVSGQNQVTKYKYNNKGQITQKTGNCCGFNTSFEYDNDGNTTRFIDANGHVSTFAYDSRGNMLSKTDALGNKLYITYNDMGAVTSFTDKNGNTTGFDLDAHGNVIKASYSENITNEFAYATNGDMLSMKDGNGNTTSYKYDSYGDVIEIHKPLGVTYLATYDTRSRLLATKDPNGNSTVFTNDALDRITALTDAANHAVSIVYDANNNITSYTDRNGHATKLLYDASDRLLTTTNALGNSVYAIYDEHDNLTAYTDENGHITKLMYDDLNRLTQVVNAANEVMQYAYDPAGRLSNMIYPNGNNVSIKRDARDRIIQITDNIGTISQRQYDAKGNLLTVTNALGNITKFSYDRLYRLVKRTDPLNFSEEYTYDKNFNITSFKDKNGHAKQVSYDALNRAIIYTNALGAVTAYTYDAAGNLIAIKDANNNSTTYTYDNLNRKIHTAYAIGPVNSSTFDNNGNVVSYTDGKGVVTNYLYDATDQLTKMDFPGTDDYLYSYDAAGNLSSATNADAIVNFSYDSANRIVSEKLNGRNTVYTYNVQGRSLTLNYPSGRTITKKFDERNRLIGINEGNQPLFAALYNGANQITKQTNSNGGVINFSYDNGGRLLNKLSNSIPAIGFQYTYDNAGNKLSEFKTHKPDHSEQYVYDNEDQLVEFKYGAFGTSDPVRSQKFVYDKLGNRTTATINGSNVSYVSNALNQYTSVNGITQTFDANGNLASDGTSTYNYNVLNQLTSANTTTLKYDALNRLIKVAIPDDSTVYNYSFLNTIEIKKTGNDISNVFGNGLDDLSSFKNNGQNFFAIHNNINSVTNIVDSANQLSESYEYDPFGDSHVFDNSYSNIVNSNIGNEILFAGRNKIKSTGHYNFRFRYLNYTQGRFIQTDPLEYINGMNMLSYTINNPINWTDPLGSEIIIDDSFNEDEKFEIRKILDKIANTTIGAQLLELIKDRIITISKDYYGDPYEKPWTDFMHEIKFDPFDNCYWTTTEDEFKNLRIEHFTPDIVLLHELGHVSGTLDDKFNTNIELWENEYRLKTGRNRRTTHEGGRFSPCSSKSKN